MAIANLSQLLRREARRWGPRVALRHKRDGLYHDISWTEYRRQADRAAAALVDWGLEPGDRVGILAENRYEWLLADIAILAAGAIDVPMHAPLTAPQVQYQLAHSGCRAVVVSNQSQADKVLASLGELPELELLICFDPFDSGEHPKLRQLSWDGLVQRGFAQQAGGFAEIVARESRIGRDDLATIIYTSGTTGHPKGVMLTHGNLLSNAESMASLSAAGPDDVLLSWLPYSHIYARTVDHYLSILTGGTLALAESLETVIVNLAETQPTMLTSVPRFYEKVWSNVEQLPAEHRRVALARLFGPRIRTLYSGAAPLPPHVCAGFFEAGIPLLEGYGLTESSPVISFNRPDAYKFGTVGQAIPGVEVKIADDGEILTRGPHVMRGYWRNDEATAAVLNDGWLATGDVGTLDDEGFLSITDRKKDLIITSLGKNVAPSELERLLCAEPLIDQSILYGDGKPFISAVVIPNLPALEQAAAELGTKLELDSDGFITSEPLRKLVGDRIDAVMQQVSNPERVKQFLLLGRPLKLEAEELTATLKVRRSHIIAKFRGQLDRLYEQQSGE